MIAENPYFFLDKKQGLWDNIYDSRVSDNAFGMENPLTCRNYGYYTEKK